MAINVKQIEAFRVTMLVGTVTAAAERLRISQPAVSRLLSQLEGKTGLKLFIRSKQRLHPTPEAVLFHREIERSFVGLEALERAAGNIKSSTSGTLRIAAVPVVSTAFLPRVLAAYRRRHPDVSVSVQTRSSAVVTDWISASDYDIGFATGGQTMMNLENAVFASVPGVCILPPGHRLASKKVIGPHDLEGEEFISSDTGQLSRIVVDDAFRQAGVRRLTHLDASFSSAIASMVSYGLGVSIVSPLAIVDRNPESLVVREFQPEIPFAFSILYRKDVPLSLAAKSFVAVMRAEMAAAFGEKHLLPLPQIN
jgi:DNA-binding transcriptional LysR family regulator